MFLNFKTEPERKKLKKSFAMTLPEKKKIKIESSETLYKEGETEVKKIEIEAPDGYDVSLRIDIIATLKEIEE